MCRVPWRRLIALRPQRQKELDDGQRRRERQPPAALRQYGKEHPATLAGGNAACISTRTLAARRMRDGDTKPLTDGSEPKDHVAHDANGRIEISEESRYTCGQHEDPDHLYQNGQTVRRIVGVVRRGEPRKAHPRPKDREEDDRVHDEDVAAVSSYQLAVHRRRRLRDRHDKGEIEEQLEGRRGTVLLVRVTRRHQRQ